MADNIFLGEDKYTMYRGKPLVRAGNTICYGDMSDKCVLFMMILSEKSVTDTAGNKTFNVPDQILIQILSTDSERTIKKQLTKQGLYDALDVGIVWLDKFNAE